jgi:hypothetical protein
MAACLMHGKKAFLVAVASSSFLEKVHLLHWYRITTAAIFSAFQYSTFGWVLKMNGEMLRW